MSQDLSLTAAQLAPLLPYLLKGGIELAKSAAGELGKKLSADAWDGLKALATKIRHKAEAKPALQEALTDAQTTPADPDAQAALRLQLKKLLAEEPDLAAEAAAWLNTIESSVQTGDVSGGKVTGVRAKKGSGSGNLRVRSKVKTGKVSGGEVTGVEIDFKE
jgi:uncharacterized membrane protein YqiK